jgi:16S rRNA (uracil1498-N3)-methyltransferase
LTRRFYVEPRTLAAIDRVELAGPLAHRLSKVLRLRAGDEIVLFDSGGTDVLVRIDEISDRRVGGTALARVDSPPEPRVKLNLYQSITKGDRFEWLLEKGTEIGITRFVPLITARTVAKPEGGGNRAERWRRIVVEAAEQCGRGAVPRVGPSQRFGEALSGAPGVLLLPYEAADDAAPDIHAAITTDIDALFALSEVSVFIGPEGGYDEAEVEMARARGATVVTMGHRILRSETAGLVAATLVMHAAGQLG